MDKVTKIAIDELRGEVSELTKNITSLTQSVQTIRILSENHDEILVRGSNNVPPLREDVHNLLDFMKSIKFWITALALAFMGQFVVVGVTMLLAWIQLFPTISK